MSDSKRVDILARVDPICTLRHTRCKAFSDPLDPSATAESSPMRSACTFLSLPPPPVSHDLRRSCFFVWISRSPARKSSLLLVLWNVWCELYLRITRGQIGRPRFRQGRSPESRWMSRLRIARATRAQPHRHSTPKTIIKFREKIIIIIIK